MAINLTDKEWIECRMHVQSMFSTQGREIGSLRAEVRELREQSTENKISIAKIMAYGGVGAMIGMALFQAAMQYGATP